MPGNAIQLVWQRCHVLALSVSVCAVAWLANAPLAFALAFPGAEGFGAIATGGRGGTVYHVTNLDDAGVGSLRDAISGPNRIVVFDVGGVINLRSQLVGSSRLTIAGQSAPGDGITVNGHGISFSEKSNVVVRYLRFRSSHLTSAGTKTVNVTSGDNMIFDHCSISWGRWDNLGFTGGTHDITLQNCTISEAIAPQRLGGLIDGGTNITIARNLWIDNQSRIPKGKGNIQYINNVVYNWGSNGYVGGHSAAIWNQDILNNYFIKGPSSGDTFLSQFASSDHIFQIGNLVDLDRDGMLGGRDVIESDFKPNNSTSGSPTFAAKAFNHPSVPVTVASATDAYSLVLADAGDSLHRDSVDQRLIRQVLSLGSLGAIIADETVVGGAGDLHGGAPPPDTDQDGIPDAWEVLHGLNPSLASDGAGFSGNSGYTNVEIYLNSLARLRTDTRDSTSAAAR